MRIRPRRLRRTPLLREALAETRLHASQLVQPHFVVAGESTNQPIDALPGIARLGIRALVEQVEADLELRLSTVLLFGLYESKDARDPAAAQALSALTGGKLEVPVMTVGSNTVRGYEQGAWARALDAAGYPSSALLPAGTNVKQAAAKPQPDGAEPKAGAPDSGVDGTDTPR